MTSKTIARLIPLLAAAFGLFAATLAQAQSDPLKIGIIDTGRIGSALARHWVAAGDEVFMSSRHPEELADLARELGPRARAGTPREAAAFGDVVLVSVPYSAMPQIGHNYAAELSGKIVLDTSNPVQRRDGDMAVPAPEKGSGIASQELLTGTRLTRAFNCIPAASLLNEPNRQPARIAIPIAADDAAARAMAERLVNDAGFDPVFVGALEAARHFDLGQPLARGNATAAELRQAVTELLGGR